MIRLSVDGLRWSASGSLTRESCDSFVRLLVSAELSDPTNAPRVLDLADLENVDMQGVQVLAAFVASGPGRFIEGANGPVRALLERVGALHQLVEAR